MIRPRFRKRENDNKESDRGYWYISEIDPNNNCFFFKRKNQNGFFFNIALAKLMEFGDPANLYWTVSPWILVTLIRWLRIMIFLQTCNVGGGVRAHAGFLQSFFGTLYVWKMIHLNPTRLKSFPWRRQCFPLLRLQFGWFAFFCTLSYTIQAISVSGLFYWIKHKPYPTGSIGILNNSENKITNSESILIFSNLAKMGLMH